LPSKEVIKAGTAIEKRQHGFINQHDSRGHAAQMPILPYVTLFQAYYFLVLKISCLMLDLVSDIARDTGVANSADGVKQVGAQLRKATPSSLLQTATSSRDIVLVHTDFSVSFAAVTER
jgi:hypothetical protein